MENYNLYVTKEFTFESSHSLPGFGACANNHGHSYKLQVTVKRKYSELSPEGVVVNFKDLKAILSPVIEEMDHNNLNTIMNRPTAENTLIYIYETVRGKMDGIGAVITKMKLWETATSYATLKFKEE